MIYESLNCLAEELNVFFRSRLGIHEDKVIVSGIMGQDGTVAVQGENKVLITLVNVMKDVNVGRQGRSESGLTAAGAKPVAVQLLVLISCYFAPGNYAESLRFLSFVMGFLQEKNVFTHANAPRLDDSLEKLVFEMESFDTATLNNIWSTIGAKAMPAVFYRVRLVVFDSGHVQEYRPAISGLSGSTA